MDQATSALTHSLSSNYALLLGITWLNGLFFHSGDAQCMECSPIKDLADLSTDKAVFYPLQLGINQFTPSKQSQSPAYRQLARATFEQLHSPY